MQPLNKVGPATLAFERHYSPDEIAVRWGFSVKVIREIFELDEDVLRVDRPQTRNKRRYCSMRIPESTVARVYAKLKKKRS